MYLIAIHYSKTCQYLDCNVFCILLHVRVASFEFYGVRVGPDHV